MIARNALIDHTEILLILIVVVVLTVIAVGVPTTSFILQAYAQGDGWAAGEEEGRDRMPSMIENITQNALLITLIFGVQCTN